MVIKATPQNVLKGKSTISIVIIIIGKKYNHLYLFFYLKTTTLLAN